MMRGFFRVALPALLVCAVAGACHNGRGDKGGKNDVAKTITGGDPERGKAAINKYGCGGCHTIPGIDGATATVGPPLNNIASRQTLGGHLSNTPDNMKLWIRNPQKIDPKNVMPDMDVTEEDARDITAYLYTLK